MAAKLSICGRIHFISLFRSLAGKFLLFFVDITCPSQGTGIFDFAAEIHTLSDTTFHTLKNLFVGCMGRCPG